MSVNKVILLGNVGKDPDVKRFDNGGIIASFSIATTDRSYKLNSGIEVPERTEWHNIVMSNKLAEIAEKYVHKGDKLYVEGKIRTRSYDDQKGIKRYLTEIYVDSMQMLSCKSESQQPVENSNRNYDQAAYNFQKGDLPF